MANRATAFRLMTEHGERWHMVLGLSVLDPVDGKRAIHLESMDVTDQVETERACAIPRRCSSRSPTSFRIRCLTWAWIASFDSSTAPTPIGLAVRARRSSAWSVREVVGPELDTTWDGIQPKLMAGERVNLRAPHPAPAGRALVASRCGAASSESGKTTGAFVFH